LAARMAAGKGRSAQRKPRLAENVTMLELQSWGQIRLALM
jgi:hypothetical protein